MHRKYAGQSLTAGTLWFAGDLLCQRLTHQKNLEEAIQKQQSKFTAEKTTLDKNQIRASTLPEFHIDWNRAATMTSFGVFIAGPLYTFWYRLLDDKFVAYFTRTFREKSAALGKSTSSIPTTASSANSLVWRITIAKLAADIFVFDPPYLGAFFTSTHLMSGSTIEETKAALRQDFLPTYYVDIALWTPVQFFNFRYVPVTFQPVVVNLFNIGWNSYLSYIKHQDHTKSH